MANLLISLLCVLAFADQPSACGKLQKGLLGSCSDLSKEVLRSSMAPLMPKKMTYIKMHYSFIISVQIRGQDFSFGDFKGTKISRSSFIELKAQKTAFTGTFFRKVDLRKCDLEGATFFGAKLKHINFSGCNLKNVSFKDAFISFADFTDANLEGADFSGAVVIGSKIDKSKIREKTNDFK